MNKNEHALIVAGGKGTRIQSTIPKQFMELSGKPILVHTIEAFYRYNPDIEIVVVLPSDDFARWNTIVDRYQLPKRVVLQSGGQTRFQSVKNGLKKIDHEGLVAIHDAVRPLVSPDIIAASFRMASVHQSAVASVGLKESIRMTGHNYSKAVDRSTFRLIQTPQTFDVQLIKKAYEQKEEDSLTDDASVAERYGAAISLFEGSYENIKITTPEDLVVAEALLKARAGL